MRVVKSSVSIMTFALLMSMSLCLFSNSLPVFVINETTCGLEMEAGRELMALKGVLNGAGAAVCSNWSFPTSIVCNGVSYQVTGNCSTGDFSVRKNPGQLSADFHGEVVRVPKKNDALALGFGRLAFSSLGVSGIASGTRLIHPNSNTNAFYITNITHQDDDVSVLIWRNVYLIISGSTNKMDIAVSLMNAGLQANERMPDD